MGPVPGRRRGAPTGRGRTAAPCGLRPRRRRRGRARCLAAARLRHLPPAAGGLERLRVGPERLPRGVRRRLQGRPRRIPATAPQAAESRSPASPAPRPAPRPLPGPGCARERTTARGARTRTRARRPRCRCRCRCRTCRPGRPGRTCRARSPPAASAPTCCRAPSCGSEGALCPRCTLGRGQAQRTKDTWVYYSSNEAFVSVQYW